MAIADSIPFFGRAELTKGRVPARTFTYGLPLFMGMILHSLFNVVDIIIVGNIADNGIVNHGEKAILALTLASFWNMLFMVAVNGVSTSSVAIISRHWGENQREQGMKVARQSLLLMVWVSLISASLAFLARPLIAVLGAEGDVLDMASRYMMVQMAGAFTMYFMLQITAVMRAAGDAIWPMIILVGANALNLVADLVLVYGYGPFPKMGVLGAAWGTIFSRGLFMAIGAVVLLVGTHGMRLRFRGLRHDWKLLWQLLRLGVPNGGQITVRIIAYMVVARFVMMEGPLAGAAFSVTAGRLDMFAMFGAAGWGAAASAMVGQNLGAGKFRRAAASGWWAVIYGATVGAVMGVCFYFYAGPIIDFFFIFKEQTNPELVEYSRHYLSIICPSYPFIAIGLILAQSINGAGDMKTPLLFDALAFLLFQIPLAVGLRYLPWNGHPLGLTGVYLAMSATAVLLAGIYSIYFILGRWKAHQIK